MEDSPSCRDVLEGQKKAVIEDPSRDIFNVVSSPGSASKLSSCLNMPIEDGWILVISNCPVPPADDSKFWGLRTWKIERKTQQKWLKDCDSVILLDGD